MVRSYGQALRPAHGATTPTRMEQPPTPPGKHSRRGEVIRASPSPCTWSNYTDPHGATTDATGQA
ncbi:MAG: hypothetical protein IPN76_16755 [Saprospiraceae bacterium]|nr:hypothetical protein [Saprospiraceae bacterium]